MMLVGDDGDLCGAQRSGADRATKPSGVAVVNRIRGVASAGVGARAILRRTISHLAVRRQSSSLAVDAEPVSMMTALLPLAYGYLRDDLIDGRDRAAGDDTLRAAATSLGYELATVFHEPPPQNGLLPPAFVDLIQECRRAAAHTVITLQGHLSNMAMSRMVLQEVLHARAEAVVHEIGHQTGIR
ncbi:hypothetical protein ABZW96_37530 [Nocardia sp. NPDC004168]|uniref:hypothetical protein n=1 Tax=Nocardia sp. NPDC004168 TaxID=3154452 RepID=UPI0033BA8348